MKLHVCNVVITYSTKQSWCSANEFHNYQLLHSLDYSVMKSRNLIGQAQVPYFT